MKEWGCRGIFIPKLALRTVLIQKSCLLELLPNLPCLHISLFSFLTVLCSSSGKLHHHCNRKANNASMFLSFFHFVSRAASSSTSSPSDSLFCPPHLPHIFLVYDPPSSPSSPLPCSFFRWEAVLSAYKSIGLAHLWAGLQRQHHPCVWLYSMSKGGQ